VLKQTTGIGHQQDIYFSQQQVTYHSFPDTAFEKRNMIAETAFFLFLNLLYS
jgi:predicted ester cyclase